MDVILLQKVENLGNLGDRVKVRAGYGRNFLLPTGKATPATPENVKKFEERRAELEKAAQEAVAKAEARRAELQNLDRVVITAKAGDEGKLFGSIGTADIAEAVSNAGVKTEKKEVRMPAGAIRAVGEYEVEIHFHTDVDASVTIVVEAE